IERGQNPVPFQHLLDDSKDFRVVIHDQDCFHSAVPAGSRPYLARGRSPDAPAGDVVAGLARQSMATVTRFAAGSVVKAVTDGSQDGDSPNRVRRAAGASC